MNNTDDLPYNLGFAYRRVVKRKRVSASGQGIMANAGDAMSYQLSLPSIQNDMPRSQLGCITVAHGQDVSRPDGWHHTRAGNTKASLSEAADHISDQFAG